MLIDETHRSPGALLALADSLELFEGNLVSHCYHLLSVVDYEKPFSTDSGYPSLYSSIASIPPFIQKVKSISLKALKLGIIWG